MTLAIIRTCIAKIDNKLTQFHIICSPYYCSGDNRSNAQCSVRGAIIPRISSASRLIIAREVPGSNLLAAAVVPLGKALYPHCLVSRKGLKAVGSLVACL